jgi:hypothetical protein
VTSDVRSVLLVAFAVLIVNCASSQPVVITPPSPSRSVRPTEPIAAPLRTTCATRVLGMLVDAINTRNDAALGQVIGSGPAPTQAFQWVSISASGKGFGPGTGEAEYSPEAARRMLLQHAANGEHWLLGTVAAGNGPSWHSGIDAELHLERQSIDGRIVKTSGKTALSCLGTAVYVLSLGDD